MAETNCWTLLEDDSFVRWVLHPESSPDKYWESWLRSDPRHPALLAEAKVLLGQLQQYPPDLDTHALSHEIWEGIQPHLVEPVENPVAKRSGRIWYAAAAIVISLGAVGLLWTFHYSPVQTARISIKTVVSAPNVEQIYYQNKGNKPERIYLVDGSTVILEKGSTLHYSVNLSGPTREVSLDGNAYFDIAQDPHRPFLVHTGGIVTRVLGTSFSIKVDPTLDDIHVAVRTGKVSVCRDGNNQAVFVLPHQEVVYYRKEQNLVFQSNAPVRLLTPPPADIVFLNFEDEPVTSILDQLGKLYHIHIVSNGDSLSGCRLTTSLQNEKLMDQLSIVCKAINAGYEMKGDTVWIKGGHCQ